MAESLRERGLRVIFGDATRPDVLAEAHLERARLVVIAAPDAYQARAILDLARKLNPTSRWSFARTSASGSSP